jgi:Threonine synthase
LTNLQKSSKVLVVASAGNTARAFAQVCSENNIPLIIVIPFDNLNALWFKNTLNSCVKIICSPKGSDYFDAIALSNKICSSDKYLEEGGAKNVARRDGMSTTVLSAAEKIGRIPDYYFQAIGSGTGTIAAYEANLRLIEDGRFGNHLMKLNPSQNVPFTPHV